MINLNNTGILETFLKQKNMSLKDNIYHSTQISFAYNNNKIEGSSITENETRLMYETNSLLTENSKTSNIDDIFITED